jgi:hypothetical protein
LFERRTEGVSRTVGRPGRGFALLTNADDHTNDSSFKRVTELRSVVLLDDMA